MKIQQSDYLIIGAGIVGLTIARELLLQQPNKKIIILEKESKVGCHSSSRNSGVLHAGFYYSADSLKAKFAFEGNKAMLSYCNDNGLLINKCGKVVVTSNEAEINTLFELKRRGDNNGSGISIIDEKELNELEPNAKTYQHALWSPHTATVDPLSIINCLVNELSSKGVVVKFNSSYVKYLDENSVLSSLGDKFIAHKIINTAGLYADKIAQDFGYANKYSVLPFKGLYLQCSAANPPVKTNIYPVPNIDNPFLGVHFTVTANGSVKVGPTAIPALWRENYNKFDNFSLKEFISIAKSEMKLLISNKFNFRGLAIEELQKYNRYHLVKLASKMVKNINHSDFRNWGKVGIRAQLLNVETLELVQDFLIESGKTSLHILNAVSPGFTCSIPFAKYIVREYL